MQLQYAKVVQLQCRASGVAAVACDWCSCSSARVVQLQQRASGAGLFELELSAAEDVLTYALVRPRVALDALTVYTDDVRLL